MRVTFPVLDFRTPWFEELHVAVYFVIGAPLVGGLTNLSLMAPAATLTADEQQVGAEGEPTRRNAPELAATLGGAITDGSLTYLVRTDRQAALDHAQAQLGRDRYDAAHATGTAMSYDRIVKYTLAELDRLLAENKQLTGT